MFGLYLLILFLNLKFWLTFPQQSKADKRCAIYLKTAKKKNIYEKPKKLFEI